MKAFSIVSEALHFDSRILTRSKKSWNRTSNPLSVRLCDGHQRRCHGPSAQATLLHCQFQAGNEFHSLIIVAVDRSKHVSDGLFPMSNLRGVISNGGEIQSAVNLRQQVGSAANAATGAGGDGFGEQLFRPHKDYEIVSVTMLVAKLLEVGPVSTTVFDSRDVGMM